jgi:Enolase C-terminal domain-like
VPRTFWRIWREAYPEARRRGTQQGLNPLVSSFGSSLFERALADAAGRLAGVGLVEMLRDNVLDLRPGEVHAELSDADLAAWAGREPPATLAVRHTVGLVDPIVAADLDPERGDDGLPRTLEEYVTAHGLRYFKLKVAGEVDADVDRLERIAAVLDRLIPDRYQVTVDGNEQYKSIHQFERLIEAMRRAPRLRRLMDSILFIEQPLDRAVALDAPATEGLREVSGAVPLLIDESDGDLDSFKSALALGYRGVSSKNCKGIVKAFLNRTLVERLNRGREPGARLFMSAEDLTNVPVVPVQQDLTTVRALGIGHVERNGHHYVRGLAHCSLAEREAATRRHPDLYRGDGLEAWVRITDGQLRVGSLDAPGYGIAFDPDLQAMIPLQAWRRESNR